MKEKTQLTDEQIKLNKCKTIGFWSGLLFSVLGILVGIGYYKVETIERKKFMNGWFNGIVTAFIIIFIISIIVFILAKANVITITYPIAE